MKLADITRIDSGYHFRGRIENDPEGPVAVIQTKDFSDDLKLNPDGLVRVVPETKVEAYRVESGDVLFLSRGQRPWAAVVGELPFTCIVPSSFYILRVERGRILPGYLAWFLNQPTTLTAMRSLMRGTNIPFISKTDLRNLPVPLPTFSTQERIVSLNQLATRERELLQGLAERKKTLINAVCMKLAEDDK
jgi:restriction endonuclease S subunit